MTPPASEPNPREFVGCGGLYVEKDSGFGLGIFLAVCLGACIGLLLRSVGM